MSLPASPGSSATFDLSSLAGTGRHLKLGPQRIMYAAGTVFVIVGIGVFSFDWFIGGRNAGPLVFGVLFPFFGAFFLLLGARFGARRRSMAGVLRIHLDEMGVDFELDNGNSTRLAWNDPSFSVEIDDLANAPLESRKNPRFWVRVGTVPYVAQSPISMEAVGGLVSYALSAGLTVDRKTEAMGDRLKEDVDRILIHAGPPSAGSVKLESADSIVIAPLPTYRP